MPGFIAASVWIRSWKMPCPSGFGISRPTALIIPIVTVKPSPSGLPIAIAQSPIAIISESPSTAACRPTLFVTLSRAISTIASIPTSSAAMWDPLISVISIASASATTWALVNIYSIPWYVIITPEPTERASRSCWSRRSNRSSKKRRNNGSSKKRSINVSGAVLVMSIRTTAGATLSTAFLTALCREAVICSCCCSAFVAVWTYGFCCVSIWGLFARSGVAGIVVIGGGDISCWS